MPLCGECVNRRPGKPGALCDVAVAVDQCKDVEASDAIATALAEAPADQPNDGEQAVVDVEEIATEEEADRLLPEGSRRSLREKVVSLLCFRQLRHKPTNPYCDTCRRSKLRFVRKLAGSCKRDATHWRQHVTGDHMVSLDEMGRGLDANADAFVITDVYSGLRAAYPTPDKSVDTTTMAIRTFAGDRTIHKLYADRSGEISRPVQTIGIMPQGGQPGVPQTNTVAERANGGVLAGTRALLLAAVLPYYFMEYAMRCYCLFDHLCRADGEGVSPWSRSRGRDFKGKLVPFGSGAT